MRGGEPGVRLTTPLPPPHISPPQPLMRPVSSLLLHAYEAALIPCSGACLPGSLIHAGPKNIKLEEQESSSIAIFCKNISSVVYVLLV